MSSPTPESQPSAATPASDDLYQTGTSDQTTELDLSAPYAASDVHAADPTTTVDFGTAVLNDTAVLDEPAVLDAAAILDESADADDQVHQGSAAVAVASAGSAARGHASATKPARKGLRRTLIAAGTALLFLVGGGVTAMALHKNVEIDLNGETLNESTFAGNVGSLLDELDIQVAERDLVVPSIDEKLSDGDVITIRTAQEIDVSIEGETTTLWTHGLTASEALEQLQERGTIASMVASRSSERADLSLPLATDETVLFRVDGEEISIDVTGTVDLAGALLLAEITLSEHDVVEVHHESGQPIVVVTRVEYRDGESTEAIAFDTQERDSDQIYRGETRVAQEGQEGVETTTFTEKLVNGEVVETEITAVSVTTEPVTRIVENGTKARPAPVVTSSSSSSSGSSSSSSGGSAVSGDVWARLAQCESGGNPSIVSSNGLYHGLYQFSVATWQSVGGTGLPSQASPAEQTARAQALQARSGWGQWPHCSSVLGLR